MVCLGPKLPRVQKLQGVPTTPEEVRARLEPLHGMRDQVKVIQLGAGGLEEVSRKTSRGANDYGGKLRERNECCPVEPSGRAASQDHLLDGVLRLFFFP